MQAVRRDRAELIKSANSTGNQKNSTSLVDDCIVPVNGAEVAVGASSESIVAALGESKGEARWIGAVLCRQVGMRINSQIHNKNKK